MPYYMFSISLFCFLNCIISYFWFVNWFRLLMQFLVYPSKKFKLVAVVITTVRQTKFLIGQFGSF